MARARYLGVQGWVRNLRDGRVEALVEGERSRLEELIRFCHLGPPGAKVSDVSVEWADWKGELQGFRIIH